MCFWPLLNRTAKALDYQLECLGSDTKWQITSADGWSSPVKSNSAAVALLSSLPLTEDVSFQGRGLVAAMSHQPTSPISSCHHSHHFVPLHDGDCSADHNTLFPQVGVIDSSGKCSGRPVLQSNNETFSRCRMAGDRLATWKNLILSCSFRFPPDHCLLLAAYSGSARSACDAWEAQDEDFSV